MAAVVLGYRPGRFIPVHRGHPVGLQFGFIYDNQFHKDPSDESHWPGGWEQHGCETVPRVKSEEVPKAEDEEKQEPKRTKLVGSESWGRSLAIGSSAAVGKAAAKAAAKASAKPAAAKQPAAGKQPAAAQPAAAKAPAKPVRSSGRSTGAASSSAGHGAASSSAEHGAASSSVGDEHGARGFKRPQEMTIIGPETAEVFEDGTEAAAAAEAVAGTDVEALPINEDMAIDEDDGAGSGTGTERGSEAERREAAAGAGAEGEGEAAARAEAEGEGEVAAEGEANPAPPAKRRQRENPAVGNLDEQTVLKHLYSVSLSDAYIVLERLFFASEQGRQTAELLGDVNSQKDVRVKMPFLHFLSDHLKLTGRSANLDHVSALEAFFVKAMDKFYGKDMPNYSDHGVTAEVLRNHAGGKLFKGPVKELKHRILTNLEVELVAKLPPVLMRVKTLDEEDVTLLQEARAIPALP